MALLGRTFQGKPIKARVKSSNLVRGFFVPSQMTHTTPPPTDGIGGIGINGKSGSEHMMNVHTCTCMHAHTHTHTKSHAVLTFHLISAGVVGGPYGAGYNGNADAQNGGGDGGGGGGGKKKKKKGKGNSANGNGNTNGAVGNGGGGGNVGQQWPGYAQPPPGQNQFYPSCKFTSRFLSFMLFILVVVKLALRGRSASTDVTIHT
jgi:hypothetical protein